MWGSTMMWRERLGMRDRTATLEGEDRAGGLGNCQNRAGLRTQTPPVPHLDSKDRQTCHPGHPLYTDIAISLSLSLFLQLLFTASTLAWKIPWMEEPGRLQSMGSLRVGHEWATSLSLFTFMHWRRKRQSTPVFLPGESQGWGSLVGCCLWGRTELDTTEVT